MADIKVPESYKRKLARDNKLKAEADAAAQKAVKDNADFEKQIFEKAKNYEAEYAAVNTIYYMLLLFYIYLIFS